MLSFRWYFNEIPCTVRNELLYTKHFPSHNSNKWYFPFCWKFLKSNNIIWNEKSFGIFFKDFINNIAHVLFWFKLSYKRNLLKFVCILYVRVVLCVCLTYIKKCENQNLKNLHTYFVSSLEIKYPIFFGEERNSKIGEQKQIGLQYVKPAHINSGTTHNLPNVFDDMS